MIFGEGGEGEEFILMESRFHSACSSVRLLGNELRNIRSCLVQELLQIEEKKNIKLNQELEALKVARDKESREVMYLQRALRQNEGESKTRIRKQSDETSNNCAHVVSSATMEDQHILPSHLPERSYSHCWSTKSNVAATVTKNSNVPDVTTEDHVEVTKADISYPSVLLVEAEEEHEVITVDKVEKEAERDQLVTTFPLAEKGWKKTTEAAPLSSRETVTHCKGCSTQGKIMGKILKLQLKRVKFGACEEEKQKIAQEQSVPRVYNFQCFESKETSLQSPSAAASTKVGPLLSSGLFSFHEVCRNLRYPKNSTKPNLGAADQANSPLKASLDSLGSSPVLSDRKPSPKIPMQDTSPNISFSFSNSMNASRITQVKKKGKVLKLNTPQEDRQGIKNKESSAPLTIEVSSKPIGMEQTSVMSSIAEQGGKKQLKHARKKEIVKSNKRAETMRRGGVGLSMTTLGNPSPRKKRKTLFGSTSRVKSDALELSVVYDEMYLEMSTNIRMNTSNLIAPKLKKIPFSKTNRCV